MNWTVLGHAKADFAVIKEEKPSQGEQNQIPITTGGIMVRVAPEKVPTTEDVAISALLGIGSAYAIYRKRRGG